MCSSDSLNIDLKALKADDTHLVFSLADDYFSSLEGAEVSKGSVTVALDIHKTADRCFDLSFHISGQVAVACDRCLDEMEQGIDTSARLFAKLGDGYAEDDDLVTVDESSGTLNLAWFIYQFVVLGIPIKHVHAPGKCNRAMIQMLEEHSATRSGDGGRQLAMDPRWSELLKLKETKD